MSRKTGTAVPQRHLERLEERARQGAYRPDTRAALRNAIDETNRQLARLKSRPSRIGGRQP